MFVLLVLAAFGAGFINVLGGGGSFLTLPALIAAGVPPVAANASSTVGLFPALVVTAFISRRQIGGVAGDKEISVATLAGISVVGGALGGILLLVTPEALFLRVVPWLIAFATAIFAGGNALRNDATRFRLGRAGIYVAQGLVAIYGGYFGGGIGILMLAAMTLYGMRDIKAMNSLRILLAMLMNSAAVITFIAVGLIHWGATTLVGGAALAGSYAGIHAARRIPPHLFKVFIVAVGIALSVYFFAKAL